MKKTILIFVLSVFCDALLAQKKELVFATYTYSTNNRLQNLEPLCKYLTAKTGIAIKAVSYPTVQALISALRNDSVDFAMMNTSGYLLLQRNHPGKVLPIVNLDMGNDSSTNYGGCLIASKQSGIISIADLKKKSDKTALALVNVSSTSGNLVPRLLLNSLGISSAEEKLSVYYAGTHRKVTEDVLNGKAELGGCGCAEVDSARKNLNFNTKAVVIDSFSNIPLGPVVYNIKTGETLAKTIIKNLLSLHKEKNDVFLNFCNGWSEFKQARYFKRVRDNDYNALRKMFGANLALWKLIE